MRRRTWFYTLPAHWAPALINDDWTGYNEEERLTILNFIKEELSCLAVVDYYWKETSFVKYHDAYNYGVLACDCYVFECVDMTDE